MSKVRDLKRWMGKVLCEVRKPINGGSTIGSNIPSPATAVYASH